MKGVMFMASQRVSNIGRIVDTLVLGGVVIATGLFQNGALLRWLICLILSISILEIATTIIERIFQCRGICHIKHLEAETKPIPNWPHRGVWAIWAELIVLQVAIVLVFLLDASGRELILVVSTTVSIDAGGLFVGKLTRKFSIGTPVHMLRNLSPNKTYTGYLGELIFGFVAGTTIVYMFGLRRDMATAGFILLSPVFGACGDLLASGAKRQLGIKNSNCFFGRLPVFGVLEWFTKSRDGYLDMSDSISTNIILFALLVSILR